jgi:hypothetical protein
MSKSGTRSTLSAWHSLLLVDQTGSVGPASRSKRLGLSVVCPGVDQPMTWVPFCQPRASSAVSIALPGRTARKPVTMWFAGDGSLANAAGIGILPPVKALVSLGIVWLCVGVALTLAARFSSMERRPHFWVRFSIVVLAPPAYVGLLLVALATGAGSENLAGAALALLLLLLIPGLMLAPAILFASTRRSDGGDGGRGPGPDPPRPEPEPGSPRGDLPLADADRAAARVRDHNPVWRRWMRPRRPAREPAPGPKRVSR